MEEKQIVRSLAVAAKSAKFTKWEYTPLELRPNDVEVSILCCGVCHSDLHQAHDDWKIANFPLVLGHEIVGIVSKVGKDVKTLKIGQRVGIGPQIGSCGDCAECREQNAPQHCKFKVKSYNSATGSKIQTHTYGGFAESTRVPEDWAFPIPDAIPSQDCAPLLCAGITTWTPFMRHKNKLKKGSKVGILGIGGLGHVALQFANKLGYDVTALSRQADKVDEAKSFGANALLVTTDKDAMAAAARSFDFILCTISSSSVKWARYFNLLKSEGIFCMVGVPSEMRFPAGSLVSRSLNLCGSYLASPEDIKSMLEFCAKNDVRPKIEVMDMTCENADAAFVKLDKGTARYRVVLENKQWKSKL